ncbi:MAG TPA: SMP-30/gluconolactonase/LRE family protein [Acidobacteriaceae bacterium]|nr:SMP-30/gluconolactonase/LRE family protein [Acidobacteriaceae bacterium]
MSSRQSVAPEEQTLMTGLGIGESPRWHDGRLWFCNWGKQEVIAIGLDGVSEVMAKVPTSIPFCIDWLPDGRLLIVSGQERLLLRQERDGALVTHADFNGLTEGAFNEIVVDGRGNIYVNGGDIIGDIIVLVTPDGKVTKVADGISFPNGMAITQDNKTLLVAESWVKRLTAFDIAADGSLANRRVWADLGDGAPDGICIDADGAVWYADVPNKRCVRVREGGDVLAMIHLDRGCFACTLGGADGRTLFLVAAEWYGFQRMTESFGTGQVLAVEVSVPGAVRSVVPGIARP